MRQQILIYKQKDKISWGIKMIMSIPVHPQANGQAESSNKILVNNLKKRLDKRKGRWAKELPFVLWEDRTTSKVATGQTSYSLVLGIEEVIPIEVVISTARYLLQDQENTDRILAQDLNTIDDLRDLAKICIFTHQQRITNAYKSNIRARRFQIEDLVLRKTFQNTKDPSAGKLTPKWE